MGKKMNPLLTKEALRLFANGFFGAEEEEGEIPTEPVIGAPIVAVGNTVTPPTPPRTYTQEEVDRFITESKSYRKRAQDAENKVAEFEKGKMSEVEKVSKEAEQAKTRATEAETKLARLTRERSIEKEAVAQSFSDAADAILLVDLESVKTDDEGNLDPASLKAAITRLAKEKPYLIKGAVGAGSADGGARGGAAPTDKVAEYTKEYQSRGMVPMP